MSRSLTDSVPVSKNLVSKLYKDEKQGQRQWRKHSRCGESTSGRWFSVAVRTLNAKGVSTWDHTAFSVELFHLDGGHSPAHPAKPGHREQYLHTARRGAGLVAGRGLACLHWHRIPDQKRTSKANLLMVPTHCALAHSTKQSLNTQTGFPLDETEPEGELQQQALCLNH